MGCHLSFILLELLMKTQENSANKKSKRSLPLSRSFLSFIVVVQLLVLGGLLYFILSYHRNEPKNPPQPVAQGENEDFMVVRSSDYQFTRPFRLYESTRETSGYQHLRESVVQMIDRYKQSGKISEASVYFRDLSREGFISINDNEKYRPGSISKIPIMIYFFKKAEEAPGYLKKTILYDRPIGDPKKETYQEESMEVGKSYSIKDLLYKMIVHSDNIATTLLLMHLDKPDQYRKIYSDLRIDPPNPSNADYSLSARECSRFLRVLYNATYLNPEYSEFALELLSKSGFNQGLRKGLPRSVKVANKFGEAGESTHPEFSETGIVYDPENPYLLTIMTKGSDVQQQAEAISEISRVVFER